MPLYLYKYVLVSLLNFCIIIIQKFAVNAKKCTLTYIGDVNRVIIVISNLCNLNDNIIFLHSSLPRLIVTYSD